MKIAIDGYCATGKTTIGKLLSKKLGYIFIDSGLLYRYFSLVYFYLTNEQIQIQIHNQKSEIITNFSYYLNNFLLVYTLDKTEYFLNGRRAARLAKIQKFEMISMKLYKKVQKITKDLLLLGEMLQQIFFLMLISKLF